MESSTFPLSPSSEAIASAVASAASTMATSINNTTLSNSQAGAENGECRLLGPFALFIQGALGILALGSLVFKRWRERPQRPVKIWAFDASKQVVGSGLLHLANLFLSMLSSGELTPTAPKAGDYQANPCSFYLLNLAIDTTLGIPILICLLRVLTHLFLLTSFGEPPESIESGNYGHPPKTIWWLKQCLIYFLGLFGMKLCVFFIFRLCPWIIEIGDWALRWTEGDERVQVFFVMLFFPLVMNALQYYIIDSFIKNKRPSEHEPIPSEDGSESYGEGIRGAREHSSEISRQPEDAGSTDEVEVIKDDGEIKSAHENGRVPSKGEGPRLREEYDPATDGDASNSSGTVTPKDQRGMRSIREG